MECCSCFHEDSQLCTQEAHRLGGQSYSGYSGGEEREQCSLSMGLAGRDLPLNAQLFRYASWMGGDRDGNPFVTSLVTAHVVYLARWMAADLYLKEIDSLHFEVGEA